MQVGGGDILENISKSYMSKKLYFNMAQRDIQLI